jgi:trehalose 6-phosphate phosphatase
VVLRPAPAGALQPWIGDPRHSGLLSDFDGTLAPIVTDPEAAVPLPEVPGLLAGLAGRLAVVAVVSGRPVAFLAERLGPAAGGLVLAGLYGLERLDRGRILTHPGAEAWRPAVAAAVASARVAAPPGVGVEDKGLTLALHARRVPDRMGWVADFAATTAEASGLVAHPGRLSVELRPPVAVDKGTVVEQLAAGLSAACYLGDDHGDLAAFAALADRRAAGAATLAVAVASPEAPGELLAAADVVVDGPAGAVGFLRELAG